MKRPTGRVKGKIAIVTGAAKGIGKATAKLLADEGASVVATDIDEPGGRRTEREIRRAGGKALFVRHDVRLEADWTALVEQVMTRFHRIDVLVNNAGIYLIKNLTETSLEDLDRILSTNVRGVFLGMRACAPIMARRRQGSIVNLSSMDGNAGAEGHTAYGGSKGAVRTMTKDVAIEYASRGVRVNSIHPGYINTGMARYGARVAGKTVKELGEDFPVGHIGEPIDVAYGVLYLASDEAKFVTGSELIIDGGATAGS